jgi:membrane protein YdbS with pleckstrin-like domain
MMSAQAVGSAEHGARVLWEGYPSWAQFTWLYLLAALTALRGALFFRFGLSGWEWWIVGGALLIVCAAILRRWARYELTIERVTMTNGYTGREIQSVPLSDVGKVSVRQGMVAGFFDIGTLAVQSKRADRLLMLRGIADPDHLKTRIEALAWKHQPGNQASESGPVQSGDL